MVTEMRWPFNIYLFNVLGILPTIYPEASFIKYVIDIDTGKSNWIYQNAHEQEHTAHRADVWDGGERVHGVCGGKFTQQIGIVEFDQS